MNITRNQKEGYDAQTHMKENFEMKDLERQSFVLGSRLGIFEREYLCNNQIIRKRS